MARVVASSLSVSRNTGQRNRSARSKALAVRAYASGTVDGERAMIGNPPAVPQRTNWTSP